MQRREWPATEPRWKLGPDEKWHPADEDSVTRHPVASFRATSSEALRSTGHIGCALLSWLSVDERTGDRTDVIEGWGVHIGTPVRAQAMDPFNYTNLLPSGRSSRLPAPVLVPLAHAALPFLILCPWTRFNVECFWHDHFASVRRWETCCESWPCFLKFSVFNVCFKIIIQFLNET